jgi:serine/threonine protein kinase
LDKILYKRSLAITEEFIVKIFSRLLMGLDLIHHRQLLHLDIKTSNILICYDNNPILLDFGAIRRQTANPSKASSKVVTNGFSPPEQYQPNGHVGPWSDIYSVGASMRACLDGKTPQTSTDRLRYDEVEKAEQMHRKKFPEYLLRAIDWAMSPAPADRPQSVEEFMQALNFNSIP